MSSVTIAGPTAGTAGTSYPFTVTGTCYTLTLTHSGSGGNPVATPANSPGCPSGRYVAGAQVNLTVTPSAGWQVASWTGTANLSSKATSNSLTMPAASVVYQQIPVSTGGDIYLPLIRR